NDTKGMLPPVTSAHSNGGSGTTGPWPGAVGLEGPYYQTNYTLFSHLLPYIEQDNIYKQMTPLAVAGCPGATSNTSLDPNVIPVYVCPSDPSQKAVGKSRATRFFSATLAAITNYGGNYNVFGEGYYNSLGFGKLNVVPFHARIPFTLQDGTS